MLVAIDAGHGGADAGATGFGGIKEKDYTLVQSLVSESVLRSFEIQVRMTRRWDETVRNFDRARMANNWGADAFISYHFNSSNSKEANGTQILCCKDSSRGKALAQFLLNEIGALDHEEERWERVIPLPFPGFRGGSFIPTVISHTIMPAVIIETEFGSNPREALRLTDSKYILEVARATYKALQKWMVYEDTNSVRE